MQCKFGKPELSNNYEIYYYEKYYIGPYFADSCYRNKLLQVLQKEIDLAHH
jgi:hypothetical protein